MANDRLTHLGIKGLRSIREIEFDVGELSVLIGDNGSGKSTILETLEILHRVASNQFSNELWGIHGGLFSLLRKNEKRFEISAKFEVSGDHPITYTLGFARGAQLSEIYIDLERLEMSHPGQPKPLLAIERNSSVCRIYDRQDRKFSDFEIARNQPILSEVSALMSPHRAIERAKKALSAIEVHLPFETLPNWAALAHNKTSSLRAESRLEAVERLSRFGSNLASAYHALKNDKSSAHWETTMDWVRAGLGPFIESINTRAGAGGGTLSLFIKHKHFDEQISAVAVADGWLSYLAFVALLRLEPPRTVLALDEPEVHLHPKLITTLARLLEEQTDYPVIVATHSDRFLDSLSNPSQSVILCDLEESTLETRIRRPKPDVLEEWLEQYSGIGELRDNDHLERVMEPLEPQKKNAKRLKQIAKAATKKGNENAGGRIDD